MKYLILFLLIFSFACTETPKDYIILNYNTNLSEFKGKIISQMFPESNGDGVTIIFTDSNSCTISTNNCSVYLFK
jgi:hypothetical protein